MKGREWRFVRHRVVVGEISKLLGNRHRPSAATAVVVFDDDVNIGKMLLDRGFQITKPDRLQPHVGIVEVLDRRLDEQELSLGFSSYIRFHAYTKVLKTVINEVIEPRDSQGSPIPYHVGVILPCLRGPCPVTARSRRIRRNLWRFHSTNPSSTTSPARSGSPPSGCAASSRPTSIRTSSCRSSSSAVWNAC